MRRLRFLLGLCLGRSRLGLSFRLLLRRWLVLLLGLGRPSIGGSVFLCRLGCRLVTTLSRWTTSLDLGDFLADSDGVLLVGEELLERTGLRGIDSNIDLEVVVLVMYGYRYIGC